MEISPSICALLGFVALTMLLVVLVVTYRSALVLAGKKQAHEFPRTGTDNPPFIQRLQDAHTNCVENLPLVAAVILAAVATKQTAITDPLALYLLYARIGQSTVHAIAVNHWMVMIRVTFFAVQLGILVWWILKLTQLI